ncbi:MAG: hypothetical protein ACLFRD_09900, partial [Nitriliruptoraceae bacterium]
MSALSNEEIQRIIERVNLRLGETAGGKGAVLRGRASLDEAAEAELGEGIHATIPESVGAAKRALESFQSSGLELRRRIIANVREAM